MSFTIADTTIHMVSLFLYSSPQMSSCTVHGHDQAFSNLSNVSFDFLTTTRYDSQPPGRTFETLRIYTETRCFGITSGRWCKISNHWKEILSIPVDSPKTPGFYTHCRTLPRRHPLTAEKDPNCVGISLDIGFVSCEQ